jgi:hypothetical protein
VSKLHKKPDRVTLKLVLTDQLYNGFPTSKLRLCLSNVIEMSNVISYSIQVCHLSTLCSTESGPFFHALGGAAHYLISRRHFFKFCALIFQRKQLCAMTARMTLNGSTLPTYIVKCTISSYQLDSTLIAD